MMERRFHLADNGTTIQREMLCGLTTFLTMVYILSTNSSVLSAAGMPWRGVFMATALSAGLCTVMVALFANLPFAMAPGMGLNTVFSYTICLGMGYHWQEALAITFLAGISHFIFMLTPLRKMSVNALPGYLRVAAGAGLGMFIAYVGIKNTGLLAFSIPFGQYQMLEGGSVVSTSAIPSIVRGLSTSQVVAVVGLAVMMVLSALEKRTGERFAALPVGILVATFIGIPLNVTQLGGDAFFVQDASMLEDFSKICLSFFGSPGLLSVFRDTATTARTLLTVFILCMTSILDTVGTMIGIGQILNAPLFDKADMEKFAQKGAASKLDRALLSNSVGGIFSSMLGSSTTTIFLESVTGITAGGRTGLTGLVAGSLFFLCLPMANLFHIIPDAAVAPALILAGMSMLTRMRSIHWRSFEEALPSFMTILFMPLAFSILDGISIGILCHVVIQITLGNRRKIHPALFLIAAAYIAIIFCERLLFT